MLCSMRRKTDIFHPVGSVRLTVHHNGELTFSENTLYPVRIPGYVDPNKIRKHQEDSYRITELRHKYETEIARMLSEEDPGRRRMYEIGAEAVHKAIEKAKARFEGTKLLSRIARENYADIHPSWWKDKCLADSLARSRKNLIEYCMNNEWTHFATFTINAEKCDRYSLNLCNKRLGRVMNKFKERVAPEMRYILVPEEHQDGAFHYHGLMYLPLDVTFTLAPVKSRKTGRVRLLDTIDHFTKNLGFNSFSKIESPIRAAKYIVKYISKQTAKGYVRNIREQIPDAKLLLHSQGLRKASKFYIRVAPMPDCVHQPVDTETGECKAVFQMWGACRTGKDLAKLKQTVTSNYTHDGQALFDACMSKIRELQKSDYFDIAV